jgi:hypothetical protein
MNKSKIRVIKKREVADEKEQSSVLKQGKPEAARQMVSTVSSWVNDFQKRKRTETKQAIETLLTNRPQNVSS